MAERFGGVRSGSESKETPTDFEPLTHCEFCGAEYEVPREPRLEPAAEAAAPAGTTPSSCTTARPRVLIACAAVVQFGLLAAALGDLYRRRPGEVRGSRRLWTAVSFVNFVGPAAYFAFGRRSARGN
jgi:Phospholipase_D-nuclease N-terminal